jgi:hypothetical protein
MRIRLVVSILALAAVLAALPAPLVAQQSCQGRRPVDPRSAKLRVVDIHVARDGVVGRVKNSGGESALGAAVWINFYSSRRGGLLGQQCIPLGDLASGEERTFLVPVQVDSSQVQAWDYAVEAVDWR